MQLVAGSAIEDLHVCRRTAVGSTDDVGQSIAIYVACCHKHTAAEGGAIGQEAAKLALVASRKHFNVSSARAGARDNVRRPVAIHIASRNADSAAEGRRVGKER